MAVHSVGDKVYSKWPGSNLWYPGKILHKSDTLKVDVEFEDGTTLQDIPLRHIASESGMRSRSRSKGRGKSPGRSRSRSRGRSKSPSRSRSTKTKQSPSPSRKSDRTTPTRQAKTPTTPTRSSTRIKQIIEKQETLKLEERVEKDQGDVKQTSKRDTKQKVDSKVTKKSKYIMGGPISAFIMIFAMPLIVLGLIVLCNKKSCALKFDKLPSFPMSCASYCDRKAALLFFGHLILQAALACLPVGRVVKGPKGSKITHRCNGPVVLLINILALAGLIHFGYDVTIVHDKFLQLASSATSFACLAALCDYIRSRNLRAADRNEYGNTGNFVYDFFIGRSLNPRVGPLDLKFFLSQYAATTWLTINAIFTFKAYTQGTLTHTLVLVALFQGLYAVDSLLFQDSHSSRTDVRMVGFGFHETFAFVVMVPYVYSIQTRYLLEHSVKWHAGCLAGFIVMMLVGYVIYRGSNSEKNRYRKDPHNPMFANFSKIPSPSGQKLLASGWWGLCRHPNYLGDIIMAFAWTIPCGFYGAWLTYIYPVSLIMILFSNMKANDQLCQKKHGAAWDRYQRDVKYNLIPRVY